MTFKRQAVTFGRIVTQGVQNLIRNVWLTSAATFVMVVTLTILLLSAMLNMMLHDTIDVRTKDFSVGIYFVENPDEELVTLLRTTITSKPYISDITYIDKDTALARFQEIYKDDPTLLEGLTLTEDNVLPTSLDVRFNDLSHIQEIVDLAKSETYQPIVYRTSDREITRKSIEQYVGLQSFIRKASIIAAALFGSIAALIIFNTIRIAVFSRSREIEIMKLIGATPAYIRGPFLVEATLYGIMAGIISFAISYSALLTAASKISGLQTASTIEFFSDKWPLALLTTIGVGITIGFLSSVMAMSKYLRLRNW